MSNDPANWNRHEQERNGCLDGLRPVKCRFCGWSVDPFDDQECAGCSRLCACEATRVPLTNVEPAAGWGPGCDECAAEARREARIDEAFQ